MEIHKQLYFYYFEPCVTMDPMQAMQKNILGLVL